MTASPEQINLIMQLRRRGIQDTRVLRAMELVPRALFVEPSFVGDAYRDTALANPHLYGLMFGTAVPGFSPDAQGEAVAESAYQPLVAGVQRCLDAGVMMGADAERIALHLWAVSHGMVSLEIAGHLDGDEPQRAAAYRDALIFSSVPFLGVA
jgi:protein-L-isoaspartate O-methyltransferase